MTLPKTGSSRAAVSAVLVVGVVAGLALATGNARSQITEDKTQQNGANGAAEGQHKLQKPSAASALTLSVTTDQKTYAAGSAMKMTLTAKNSTKAPVSLQFGSGQRYDFVLREGAKPDGKILWQWSRGHMFTQMVTSQKLEPGKSLTYTETYTPKADAGSAMPPLKPGTYTLTATLATFGTRPTATTKIVVKTGVRA